jgi:hypothetical protein
MHRGKVPSHCDQRYDRGEITFDLRFLQGRHAVRTSRRLEGGVFASFASTSFSVEAATLSRRDSDVSDVKNQGGWRRLVLLLLLAGAIGAGMSEAMIARVSEPRLLCSSFFSAAVVLIVGGSRRSMAPKCCLLHLIRFRLY